MKRALPTRIGLSTSRVGLAALAVMILTMPASAAPRGAHVEQGQASIVQQGNQTTIHAGNNAIIDYSRFDVASDESVRFVQPGASSRVLNRVLGSAPSHIAGSVQANGIVYLVNPAGIYFEHGARLDVAGLYAAAGHLTNDDFLHHVDRFTGLDGPVVNNATIQADAVNLLGRYVANHGRISAPQGTVIMLAGHDVYMRQIGGHVFVKLDGRQLDPKARPAAGKTPASLSGKAGVDNSGSIQARGGQIILGAGDMYSLAVRNSGTVAAGSGSVTVAASDGVVNNTGRISADVANGKAGSVSVAGPDVVNSGSITADSSNGQAGSVTMVSDKHTYLLSGSNLSAAGTTGSANGGHVKVNTYHGLTTFENGAVIDVSGGSAGGRGGFVEVSGKQLSFQGSVNLGGRPMGELLLDPYDLYVDRQTGGSDDTLLLSLGSINHINDPATIHATVSASAIESLGGIIKLQADHNLVLSVPLSLSSSTDLQLYAYNDLRIDAPIQNVGTLVLTANADRTGGGDLYIDAPITNVSHGVFGTANSATIYFGGASGALVDSDNSTQYWTSNYVKLDADTTLNGSGVFFVLSPIDSASSEIPHSLTINGSVYFGQAVGAGAALTTVKVSGLTRVVGPLVRTLGDQSYAGPVQLGNDASFFGDNINFGSTVDSFGGIYKMFVNAAGNLRFGGAVGATAPLAGLKTTYNGITTIDGPGIYARGDILMNVGHTRPAVPTVATIAAPNGDLTIQAGGPATGSAFIMGPDEKLTDVGNLTISAGSQAVLGDVNSLGDMTVSAGSILINRRAGGPVLMPGGAYLPDPRTTLIAGGHLNFSFAPQFAGIGVDPIFASSLGHADLTGTLGGKVLPDKLLTRADFFHGETTVLDLTLFNNNTNLSTALPPVASQDPLKDYVPEPILLGPAGQQSMASMDMDVRPFSVAMLRAKLTGHQTIDDVSFTGSSAGVRATVYRVYRQAARTAIRQYQNLFIRQVTNGHGKTSVEDQTGMIRRWLAAAALAYRAAGGKADDGVAFSAFVMGHVGQKHAADYLQQFGALFTALAETGVTPGELTSIEDNLLSRIAPNGVSAATLRQAITHKPGLSNSAAPASRQQAMAPAAADETGRMLARD